MLELLTMPFMLRALAAGLIIGLVASFYGVFVVQRGMSFLGHGLAHSAFGGLALGILLGINPMWTAIPFTIAVALGIVWVQQRTRVKSDTAIGIFFAMSMALGVIFLALHEGYSVDAMAWLFGSILGIGKGDLWAAAGLLLLKLATLPRWGAWAYATFDRELAQADRVAVKRDEYLLTICIAITVVIASKLLGIVLVASLLVVPAAAARLFSKTFAGMTLGSLAIGTASVAGGILASGALNLPTGPMIILIQGLCFFAGAVVRR